MGGMVSCRLVGQQRCNELADKGDFDALTARINGGLKRHRGPPQNAGRQKAALRT